MAVFRQWVIKCKPRLFVYYVYVKPYISQDDLWPRLLVCCGWKSHGLCFRELHFSGSSLLPLQVTVTIQWAPVPIFYFNKISTVPGLLCHKILFQHRNIEMADCVKTFVPSASVQARAWEKTRCLDFLQLSVIELHKARKELKRMSWVTSQPFSYVLKTPPFINLFTVWTFLMPHHGHIQEG